MNIFKNAIPNEIIEINDQDPLWIIKAIKDKINMNYSIYRRYLKCVKLLSDLDVVTNLTVIVNNIV